MKRASSPNDPQPGGIRRASRNCRTDARPSRSSRPRARAAGRSAAESLDDGEASPRIPDVMPGRDQRLLTCRLDPRRPRTIRERRVEGPSVRYPRLARDSDTSRACRTPHTAASGQAVCRLATRARSDSAASGTSLAEAEGRPVPTTGRAPIDFATDSNTRRRETRAHRRTSTFLRSPGTRPTPSAVCGTRASRVRSGPPLEAERLPPEGVLLLRPSQPPVCCARRACFGVLRDRSAGALGDSGSVAGGAGVSARSLAMTFTPSRLLKSTKSSRFHA